LARARFLYLLRLNRLLIKDHLIRAIQAPAKFGISQSFVEALGRSQIDPGVEMQPSMAEFAGANL